MNNTEDYPWVKMLGDKSGKADKMKNVNNSAKELFIREFYKEFERGLEIKNGDNVYSFEKIKFNSNWTNYSLYFKGDKDNLEIKFDNSNPYNYYLVGNIEDELDIESKKILKNMFKYMKK